MAHTVKPVAEYLLGFCAAVESCGKKFAVIDSYGNPIFAEPRFLGYAAAWRTGAVKKICLFGPPNETNFIRNFLINQKVPRDAIIEIDTRVSTVGNATVMKEWIQEKDIQEKNCVLSSSGYHDRAPYFAWRNGLNIRTIPSEAFRFAAVETEAERMKIFRDIQREFYGYCRVAAVAGWFCRLCRIRTFVERCIDDYKGIGTDLAGQYKVPHAL